MKIRTGTTRGAQGQPEPAWVGPALELAADPQATLSEFVVSAGLGRFSDLIKEEVEHLAGPRGKKRPEGSVRGVSEPRPASPALGVMTVFAQEHNP